MLGGIGGRRRRGQQRMRGLDGITDSMDMGLGGGVSGVSSSCGARGGSLPRHDEDLREPLVRRQGPSLPPSVD